jgi:hypothetical protein
MSVPGRECSILPACKFLPEENLATWKNLKILIRPEAKREVQGKTTQEVRYYISDEQETNSSLPACLNPFRVCYPP